MYIRHWKGLEKVVSQARKCEEKVKPVVFWCYGKSGSGKTRWAVETFPDNVIIHNQNSSGRYWFDGYEAQECVILDDIRKGSYQYNDLLSLLDRYKMEVPIKGGHRPWLPKVIVITCPWDPYELWGKTKRDGLIEENDNFDQLLRRIDIVYHWLDGKCSDHTAKIWRNAGLDPSSYGRDDVLVGLDLETGN